MRRRSCLLALAAIAGWLGDPAVVVGQADPLPSWNDTAPKRASLDFVARTTSVGGPDFIPPLERIATFDNDGTLWAEQPIYFQFAFAIDRVHELAPRHPEWQTTEPFRSILAGDMANLLNAGEKGLLEVIAATHAGLTTEDFGKAVHSWIDRARHPRFKRPYTDLVYQPMLELLAFMRGNGFKTFIVSGGGIEFMRPWTEKTYGIPPEQVIGSSGVTKYEFRKDGKPELMKLAKVEFIDDGPGKPVGINRFIGRRPFFAFGNSDGDKEMLEWTAAGDRVRYMGLVHHDDAEREWAYDRNSPVGRLDKAWDEAVKRGWTVVSMKNDWKVIYPFEMK